MNIKFAGVFSCAILLLALPSATRAADEDKPSATPPLVELSGIRPSADVFGKWDTPTQIASAADAEKSFEGAALANLKEKVDFENQIVLVFAWRGSGQDKLEYGIAESFPEQVTFTKKHGRTRDLRPHIRIFALRKDVKWSVSDARR